MPARRELTRPSPAPPTPATRKRPRALSFKGSFRDTSPSSIISPSSKRINTNQSPKLPASKTLSAVKYAQMKAVLQRFGKDMRSYGATYGQIKKAYARDGEVMTSDLMTPEILNTYLTVLAQNTRVQREGAIRKKYKDQKATRVAQYKDHITGSVLADTRHRLPYAYVKKLAKMHEVSISRPVRFMIGYNFVNAAVIERAIRLAKKSQGKTITTSLFADAMKDVGKIGDLLMRDNGYKSIKEKADLGDIANPKAFPRAMTTWDKWEKFYNRKAHVIRRSRSPVF
jgi:hypothetical protein